MIKVEVLEDFNLKDFGKLKNLERKSGKGQEGKLFKRDTFDCDEKMCEYLTGKNPLNKAVVQVIEVIPETPTIIGHRADDVEYVVSLDDENMKKLSKNGLTVEDLDIKKEIKPKKKKSSKK